MREILIYGAIIMLLQISSQQEQKVNSLNILIPVIYEPLERRTVQYELEAYGQEQDCFEWKSSQPNLLSVQGLTQKQCNSRALVKLATNQPSSSVVWIHLTNSKSRDQSIKIESRVATLSRIEIATKLRTIDIGGYEELQLRGFDNEGNTFSTLEGLRFKWEFEPQGILQFIPLRETVIKTSELRKQLESSDFQNDIVVVKGLAVGKATINAQLNEANYPTGIRYSVTIIVIEKFTMIPHYHLYLSVAQEIRLKLFLIKVDQKMLKEISLPDKNYVWNSTSKESLIKQDGLIKCGIRAEYFDVSIQNQCKGLINLIIFIVTPENFVRNQINVVEPDSIKFQLKEIQDNYIPWDKESSEIYFESQNIQFDDISALLVGRQYYIRVQVIDYHGNDIYMGGNLNVQIALNEQQFFIKEKRNHQIVVVPKKVEEDVVIIAILVQVGEHKLNKSIKVIKNIKIITPVQIVTLNRFLIFPFNTKTPETYKVVTIGGSGQFEFTSSSTKIFTIENQHIIAKSKGKSSLLVKDLLNHNNFEMIDVFITDISTIESTEPIKEYVVGQEGQIIVKANGKSDNNLKEVPFTSCRSLQFRFEQENHFSNQVSELFQSSQYQDKINIIVQLMPQFPIKIYNQQIEHQVIQNDKLQNMLMEQFYQSLCGVLIALPIKAAQFEARLLELYQQKISLPFQVRIYNSLKTTSPLIDTIVIAYGSSFEWIVNGGPSDQLATINYGSQNVVTSQLKKQDLKERSFLVKCTDSPLDLQIFNQTIEIFNQKKEQLYQPVKVSLSIIGVCAQIAQIKIQTHSLWLLSPGTHPFSFKAFSSTGDSFYNHSSYKSEWSLKQKLQGSKLIQDENTAQLTFQNAIKAQVEVQVTASYGNRIKTDSIILDVDQNFQLSENNLHILLHPDNIKYVDVQYGSGKFLLETDDSQVVDVDYISGSKQIKISPRRVGFVNIIVKDISLPSSKIAKIQVVVAEPKTIKMIYPSKYIQIDNEIQILLEVYDNQNKQFIDQWQYMDIKIQSNNNDYIEAKLKKQGTYSLLGKSIGSDKIQAVLQLDNNKRVTSQAVLFEVFPKLRTVPFEIFLPPECTMTVQLEGGPSNLEELNLNVEFISKETKVYIIKLNPRIYKIQATKTGSGNIKFNLNEIGLLSISTLDVPINIVSLTSISLQILNNVQPGTTLRATTKLFVKGDHSSDYTICPYKYDWKVSNSNVLEVQGSSETDSARFINVKTSGEATITVQIDSKVSTTVKIISTQPPIGTCTILLPTNINYKFHQLNGQYTYSLISTYPHNDELRINPSGQIITPETPSYINAWIAIFQSNIHPSFLSVYIAPPKSFYVQTNQTIYLNQQQQLQLPIVYTDSFGRPFNVNPNENIKVTVSDPFLIRADVFDSHIRIHGIKSGYARIFVSWNGIVDYVNVHIKEDIIPEPPKPQPIPDQPQESDGQTRLADFVVTTIVIGQILCQLVLIVLSSILLFNYIGQNQQIRR